jgi:predicted metal-dependent hydrolase
LTIRSCASSSRTSSAFARSSGRRTPTSRERKAARPPKRVPGGAIEEPVRGRCSEPPPPELIEGIEQFNRGEFFAQHETLELLWRATRTPDRGLYHGILQIGVAFHHWRNGNHHGATTLLEDGIARLTPFAPSCHGVDVSALIAGATRARSLLLDVTPDRLHEIDVMTVAPRIRFTP